jgi:O-glycosyl hydrolase
VVKDIIDEAKYDIASIVPLSGSHPYILKLTDNIAEFIFENINLPFDDANNDGYISFKIKTKSTLATGDSFSNSAQIYFDYNHPIATNTATTILQALGSQEFNFNSKFTIYPNPAENSIAINSSDSSEVKTVEVYNALGQKVLSVVNPDAGNVDVSSLSSGHYYLKLNSDTGISAIKFIKR